MSATAVETVEDPDAPVSTPEFVPTGCGPCDHATVHGWWGSTLGRARTHCRNCHRSWRSLREGHCAGCCLHFADNAAFDAHRVLGVCTDPATIMKRDGSPKFRVVDGPYGVTWDLIGKPMDPARLAALRARR